MAIWFSISKLHMILQQKSTVCSNKSIYSFSMRILDVLVHLSCCELCSLSLMSCILLVWKLGFAMNYILFHKIRICNLYGLHELREYVSSDLLLEKIIYHMLHISNPCFLYELNCVHVSIKSTCLRK